MTKNDYPMSDFLANIDPLLFTDAPAWTKMRINEIRKILNANTAETTQRELKILPLREKLEIL